MGSSSSATLRQRTKWRRPCVIGPDQARSESSTVSLRGTPVTSPGLPASTTAPFARVDCGSPADRARTFCPNQVPPRRGRSPDRKSRPRSPAALPSRTCFRGFFIERPIFASVLSIVITLCGRIAMFNLPLAQFPLVAPSTVQVDCKYPGANAQDMAKAVASPIEQQVNGVEHMLYMSSQCTNDGTYNLTVTFERRRRFESRAGSRAEPRQSGSFRNCPTSSRRLALTTRSACLRHLDVGQSCLRSWPRRQATLRSTLHEQLRGLLQVKDEIARLSRP